MKQFNLNPSIIIENGKEYHFVNVDLNFK